MRFALVFTILVFVSLMLVSVAAANESNFTFNGMTFTSFSSVTNANLAKLVTGNIFNVFLQVGEWQPDHTIKYYYGDSQFTSYINQFHSYDNRFKVYAWVTWNLDGTGNIDLSQSSYRSTMYSAITECVNKGFDGFNDDLEAYAHNGQITNIIGTWQNYVDYLNGINTAVHAAGSNKISSASLDSSYATRDSCGDAIYSNVTLDYSMPMFYSSVPLVQTGFQNRMNAILKESNSPVMIQLMAGNSPTLNTQLDWLSQQITSYGAYSKLKGISMFCMEDITNSELSAWNSWIGSPVSTQTAGSVNSSNGSLWNSNFSGFPVWDLAILVVAIVIGLLLITLSKGLFGNHRAD